MLPTVRVLVSPALGARVGPRVVASLARRTRRAAQLLGVERGAVRGLGLRLVDDAEMTALHLAYLGESGPTDVLSFSPDPLAPDSGHDRGLGDIVIDWDAVERQAPATTARARLDEASVLLVHGLVHLLGHDHRDRREGRRMHRLEARVLRRLGVPDVPRPYAPRLHSALSALSGRSS